jgi:hypothetical protein
MTWLPPSCSQPSVQSTYRPSPRRYSTAPAVEFSDSKLLRIVRPRKSATSLFVVFAASDGAVGRGPGTDGASS